MKKSKVMDFFSALGRSLMMPIAALAACGIVLGLTSALMKPQVVAALPWLGTGVVGFIIMMLNKVSGVVFTLLPVLFAISIAMGLAKEDKEVAAFAGFIGYYTFLVASSLVISTKIINFSAMKISPILGVETVDMGAVAGILVGCLTAYLHNKYHKVVFPAAVAFYGGKRFVALVVTLGCALLGIVMPFVWNPLSMGIDTIGTLINASGSFGVFLFGFLERLLIPTGLHHVLNGLFRTTSLGGTFNGVEGCLNILVNIAKETDADLRKLIEKKAKERDDGDTVLALALLLQELREFYGEDIQNMNQLNVVASKHPEKDRECIQIIESAQFFQYKALFYKVHPWTMTNEDFKQHISKTDDRLWFLRNQISHIEKSYLPTFENNIEVYSQLIKLFPQSGYMRYMYDGYSADVAEAKEILQRMYELMYFSIDEDPDGCKMFLDNVAT